jgi:hypothetical protein
VILVVFLVLWFTAPEWQGYFRPGPTTGPQFALVNTTVWQFGAHPPCWPNQVGAGGTVPVGTVFSASVLLTYPLGNSSPPCTISSIRIETAGFTLVGSDTPLTIGPNETGRLFANVTVPADAYTGSLTVDVTAAVQ